MSNGSLKWFGIASSLAFGSLALPPEMLGNYSLIDEMTTEVPARHDGSTDAEFAAEYHLGWNERGPAQQYRRL